MLKAVMDVRILEIEDWLRWTDQFVKGQLHACCCTYIGEIRVANRLKIFLLRALSVLLVYSHCDCKATMLNYQQTYALYMIVITSGLVLAVQSPTSFLPNLCLTVTPSPSLWTVFPPTSSQCCNYKLSKTGATVHPCLNPFLMVNSSSDSSHDQCQHYWRYICIVIMQHLPQTLSIDIKS